MVVHDCRYIPALSRPINFAPNSSSVLHPAVKNLSLVNALNFATSCSNLRNTRKEPLFIQEGRRGELPVSLCVFGPTRMSDGFVAMVQAPFLSFSVCSVDSLSIPRMSGWDIPSSKSKLRQAQHGVLKRGTFLLFFTLRRSFPDPTIDSRSYSARYVTDHGASLEDILNGLQELINVCFGTPANLEHAVNLWSPVSRRLCERIFP